MAQPAQQLMTVEEFERLPEPPEGGKMELVDGEVVVMSPVGRKHSRVAVNIAAEIRAFVREHGLGEVGMEGGFRLFPDRSLIRAPDVHFLAAAQPEYAQDDVAFVTGAPALAIEVTSPDDRDTYLSRKVNEYLEAGSRRVWVVRPEMKAVTVHYPDGTSRLIREGEILTSEEAGFQVPGFELRLAELFR
jgi:Uma2 family endonuclease